MKIRRSSISTFALLAIAACGGETTDPTPDIASIQVTPDNPSIDVGLTVQFQAQAFDSDGNAVSGVTFNWSSSQPSVASVDANGLAQGLTVGQAAITASAGSATPGSQVLVVEPSQCNNRIDVVLSVGQFQSYDGDECLLLPSGNVGDRYRVAITRPTLIEDPNDVPNVEMSFDPILTTAQIEGREPVPSVPPFAPAPPVYSTRGDVPEELKLDGSAFVRDSRIMSATRRFHAELREREMQLGIRTDRILPSRPQASAARSSHPDPPVRDDLYLVLQCSTAEATTPVVRINFNDDVVIYQDSVENATDPLSTTATDLMLSYYSDYVKDFIEDYWGTTPDIDGNERIILTTSNALPDSAAAGVFSGDFRTNGSGAGECPNSNEAEVMYFSTDIMMLIDDPNPSYLALSVMAHEVKHITSLYNSVQRGAFHNLWIEEGTAEISQTMSSRIAWAAVGGPPVGSEIDGNDIIDAVQNNGGSFFPEIWGVISQIADLVVWSQSQPNSLITNPTGAAGFHTFYAGSWHWHRFIGDAFGDAATPFADGPLFTEMTAIATPAGTGALLQATGRTYEQLTEDIVVAMALHDVGPTPTRAFTTWDLNTASAIFVSPPAVSPPGRYPYPITTDLLDNPTRSFTQQAVYSCPPLLSGPGVDDVWENPSATDRCPIGPAGVRLHDFVSAGTGAGAQIQVSGAATGKIIVVRVN